MRERAREEKHPKGFMGGELVVSRSGDSNVELRAMMASWMREKARV
jgi:hypothetical protein